MIRFKDYIACIVKPVMLADDKRAHQQQCENGTDGMRQQAASTGRDGGGGG
jgi:hypothetical protein